MEQNFNMTPPPAATTPPPAEDPKAVADALAFLGSTAPAVTAPPAGVANLAPANVGTMQNNGLHTAQPGAGTNRGNASQQWPVTPPAQNQQPAVQPDMQGGRWVQTQYGPAWVPDVQPAPPAQAQPPSVLFDPTQVKDYGLTAEEMTKYGNSVSVIDRVVNAKMAAAEAELRKRFGAIETTMQERMTHFDNTNEQLFAAQVSQAIPQLATVRSAEGWGAYMNRPVPMTGRTVLQLVEDAYARRDIATLAELVNGFQPPASGGAFGAQAPASGVASPFANVTPPPASTVQGQTLYGSQLEQASREFVAGRMSAAVWDAIEKQFETARAEGRVDWGK